MAASLLRQLQSAAKGLLYPSEQDHTLKAFVWSKDDVKTPSLDVDAVKQQAGIAPKTATQTQSATEFFAPITTPQTWHSEEEKQRVQQAQSLQKLLTQQLSDLHVYRIGETKKDVYVVGKTADGDWAGVKTQVVET